MSTVATVILMAFAWIASATVIAHECEEVGVFYVGSKVFECNLRKEIK